MGILRGHEVAAVSAPLASPCETRVSARRFLMVVTNEGGGDIRPLLAIAAGLLARGHRVTAFGAFGDAAVSTRMAPPGIETAEQLLTVVATCRRQGRRLLDFLVAAGQAAVHGIPPPSLLPA